MNFIQKLNSRVSQYGLKYVVKVIIENKIYRPLDHVFVLFGKVLLRTTQLKNTIIMESHNDFDTNSGAFYEYLINHRINNDYKIIWLIKNKAPKNLPSNVECYNIFRPSFRKTYCICTAKIFTADDIVTEKARNDQKSYYFTHGGGIGFKRVDVPLSDSIDYILMPSEKYAPYALQNHKIEFPSDRLIYVGYPEQDLLYDRQRGKLEIGKITGGKVYTKVIVWMPTFRRGGGAWRNDSTGQNRLGIPLIESIAEYEKLNDELRKRGMLLIIKLHPMQLLDDLKVHDSSNILVLTKDRMKEMNLDNYRMLAGSDALISDFSTIAVEYFHTHNPLAFVLSDIDQYKKVDNEMAKRLMVGSKLYILDDMIRFMAEIYNGIDEYRDMREKLFAETHVFHDSNSSYRLARFMGLIEQ